MTGEPPFTPVDPSDPNLALLRGLDATDAFLVTSSRLEVPFTAYTIYIPKRSRLQLPATPLPSSPLRPPFVPATSPSPTRGTPSAAPPRLASTPAPAPSPLSTPSRLDPLPFPPSRPCPRPLRPRPPLRRRPTLRSPSPATPHVVASFTAPHPRHLHPRSNLEERMRARTTMKMRTTRGCLLYLTAAATRSSGSEVCRHPRFVKHRHNFVLPYRRSSPWRRTRP
jgi:hypothetical protein